MTNENPQFQRNLSRPKSIYLHAILDYLSIRVDSDNFDPIVAADKFEAFYICHGTFGFGNYLASAFEKYLFTNYVENTFDGSPIFLRVLTLDQQNKMYKVIKERSDKKKNT